MTTPADLLIVNAAEVVTCAGFSGAPAKGPDQGRLGIIKDGAVAVADGRIIEVGRSADLRKKYPLPADRIIDAGGGVVLPGFVDPHTHLIFAGDRSAEWEARLQGKPYLEILRAGGGIQSTVQATRAATKDELLANARHWADLCLEHGTTTIEIKSGYGLDRNTELRMLEVARDLAADGPPQVVSTYLGAHVVPTEYAGDREGYLRLVEQTTAEVRELGLAQYFDVFCEQEAFTLAETERLLKHAQGLGFDLKLHAEQFSASGAAALGAKFGAVSVDHLENIDPVALEALVKSVALSPTKGASKGMSKGIIAVLLPGVAFHLNLDTHAPARKLIDAGVPVALATDFNPGSACNPSMPMVIQLACRQLNMTVGEALIASTINAAHAVGLGAEVGSLEPGKRADVIICDIPNHKWLGYGFGWNPVEAVVTGEAV